MRDTMTPPADTAGAMALAELADTIERLEKEATQGEWRFLPKVGYIFCDKESVQVGVVGNFRDKELVPLNGERWRADGNLTVALRNNATALVAALRALADMRGALEKAPIPSKYHGQRGFEVERFLADYEVFVRDKLAALAGRVP